MAMQLTTAEFFGTPVSIIDHVGKHWLTAEEAGLCLGYNPANARQGILKAYERHQDEFTETDTCVVNLTTQGQGRASRIFSETGCNLLGFFTNTSNSKRFRLWAKEHLAGQPAPLDSGVRRNDGGDGGDGGDGEARLDRLDANMAQLAAGMATLATGIGASLSQMAVTRKYIGLLEMNQTAKRRVTAEIVQQVHALAAEGMNFADIGRLLRISRTAVSLVARDKYHALPAPGEERLAQKTVGEILDDWVAREQARLATALTEG